MDYKECRQKYLVQFFQSLIDKSRKYAKNHSHKVSWNHIDKFMNKAEWSLGVKYDAPSYELKWIHDFISNANNCHLAPKSQVISEMHSWMNPDGSEWIDATNNYPYIPVNLPREIKKVNLEPHYWYDRTVGEWGDYKPSKPDQDNMIHLFKITKSQLENN